MSSLRQKVNDFFNPVPGSNTNDAPVSAAKLLDEEGMGYEDDGDNMSRFFRSS